jgi:hypothetical protein
VHALRKGFRQAIGQRLDHDGGIVVVRVLEAVGDHVLADPGGDDEGADVVLPAGILRRDEVRKRHIGAALAPRQLLAQGVEHERLICRHLDVVAG